MKKLKLNELNRLTVESFKKAQKVNIIVVLDNIRSAMNVGSIFRTSDAMGIEKVILCGITAQPPNREITKTAIGSTDSVDWAYFSNSEDAIIQLKKDGYQVLAIEQTNESIELMEFKPDGAKLAIVLGNEVNGVDSSILHLMDGAIEIAQYGTKHSLNVAVCGGIVIHHFAEMFR